VDLFGQYSGVTETAKVVPIK